MWCGSELTECHLQSLLQGRGPAKIRLTPPKPTRTSVLFTMLTVLWWQNRSSQEICDALAWVQLSHQAQHTSLQSAHTSKGQFPPRHGFEARLLFLITRRLLSPLLGTLCDGAVSIQTNPFAALTVGSRKHYAIVCTGNWGSCVLREIPFCWREGLAGKQGLLSLEYLVDSLQNEVNEPVTSR